MKFAKLNNPDVTKNIYYKSSFLSWWCLCVDQIQSIGSNLFWKFLRCLSHCLTSFMVPISLSFREKPKSISKDCTKIAIVFLLYKMNLILYNLDLHRRIQVMNAVKVVTTRLTIILHVLLMIIDDSLIYIFDNRYVLLFIQILLFFLLISHITLQLYNYWTIVKLLM